MAPPTPVDVEQQRYSAASTNINNPPQQTVPVYIMNPVQHPLPCGGLGIGWTLFILGFLIGAIPWYIGAGLLFCGPKDEPREKPGCTACLIAAIVATVLIIIIIIASMQ